MIPKFKRLGALALALAMAAVLPQATSAQSNGAQQRSDVSADGAVMVIPARAQFPLSRKINMGVGRSTMVQFPSSCAT